MGLTSLPWRLRWEREIGLLDLKKEYFLFVNPRVTEPGTGGVVASFKTLLSAIVIMAGNSKQKKENDFEYNIRK